MEEFIDGVANMSAGVLLEFIPDGKWSLGVCLCLWLVKFFKIGHSIGH